MTLAKWIFAKMTLAVHVLAAHFAAYKSEVTIFHYKMRIGLSGLVGKDGLNMFYKQF